VVVSPLETELAERRDEMVLTTAGIARLLTTGAGQGGTSMIGVILIEPALERVAGDAQSTLTQGELERGEIVADVFA
jgi:hypothetical protein